MTAREIGAIIMSIMALVGFSCVSIAIMFVEIPNGSREVANTLLGAMAAFAGAAVNYWLGSSAGSAEKDKGKP